MRVLVAEDDRAMSQLLCSMLRAAGHQAIPAFDGASALMAAMRPPIVDLVVLDLYMPAGDGQTTLTRLKNAAKTTQIPVLVVTSEKDPKVRESVLALGAGGYLEKPVTVESFIDAVEKLGRTK